MKKKILLCLVLALLLILILSGCGKITEEFTTELRSTTAQETTESTTIVTTAETEAETTTVQYTESVTKAEETTAETTTKDVSEVITESVTETVNLCTMEIDCSTILQNEKKLSKSAKDKVPSDGVILMKSSVEIGEGDTVLDILLRVSEEKGIEVAYTDMPMFNSCYIEGINGIFEKDCGASSGWMYSVNGEFPQVGTNACTVSPGDEILFVYTCNGGTDVGDRA